MILAFDTSNYTTSAAILNGAQIVLDKRQLIKVKSGERGIRQSDAFFQHMQVLESYLERDIRPHFKDIAAIAVSTRPRPLDQSYMPVFRAGHIVANALSMALQVPLYCCSHQEGHLYSALRGIALEAPFLFLHLSGGTTEIHSIARCAGGYSLKPIAETADISVGQLIDRIGVKSGLSFPCGQAMDDLAERGAFETPPRFKVQPQFNLSGYENHFSKLLDERQPAEVYHHLFATIASILETLIASAIEKTSLKQVLLAGGVAENSVIRRCLHNSQARLNCAISFAENHYASDNAVGVAEYARHMRR